MYIRSSPRGPSRDPNRTLSNELLLLIVRYFKQWRPKLKGLLFLIRILTDHKNLQYFITIK